MNERKTFWSKDEVQAIADELIAATNENPREITISGLNLLPRGMTEEELRVGLRWLMAISSDDKCRNCGETDHYIDRYGVWCGNENCRTLQGKKA